MSLKTWRSNLLTLAALGMIAVMALANGAGWTWGPLSYIDSVLMDLDAFVYDFEINHLPPHPPSGRVVIIAVDQDAIDHYGRWPWPRSIHAQLLDRLKQAGAAAVVLDIGFISPTQTSEDSNLADALSKNGKAAISTFYRFDQASGKKTPELPLPALMDSARAVGFNMFDNHTTVRSVRLFDDSPQLEGFNSLLVDSLCIIQGINPNLPLAPVGNFLTVGKYRIPVFYGAMFIDFQVDRLPEISYVSALSGPLPDVRDKVAVVAATALEQDTLAVPCTPESNAKILPGGTLLALSIDNVLSGTAMRVAETWVGWLTVLVLELLATLIAMRFRKTWLNLTLIMGVPLMVLMTQYMVLRYAHLWVMVVAPLVAAKLAFALIYTDGMRNLSRSLASYLPQRVSEQLARRGALITGDFEATIMFQDVKGYTGLSERLSAHEVRELLTQFFDLQRTILTRHGGFVVDYQGDAQMVMFGGDMEKVDHARHAVDAAWEIVEALRGSGLPGSADVEGQHIQFGIGINTGIVSVGTLGGADQRQFSALGDTTNVASRIQTLTRELDWPLVVSESTWSAVSGGYNAECIPNVNLRGRSAPINLYKILGPKPSIQ